MRRTIILTIFAVILFTLLTFIQSRENMNSILSSYDLDMNSAKSVDLSSKLKEISGLAMSEDNRLFAHDDERGILYQLDYKSGTIIKKFIIGKFVKKADFEGIAIAGDYFYLITSAGKITEFKEAENNGSSSYELYKTKLNKKNNVEGLCYDPETESLLLACKGEAGEGFEEYKAVYTFSLKTKKLAAKPRFLIKTDRISEVFKKDEFNPSGIARHPLSGTFFILSSRGIIEISRDGNILDEKKLNNGIHNQPEGICFTDDYTLLISDEGSKKGKLTRYKIKK
jgi:uncharacterized protein YjiK